MSDEPVFESAFEVPFKVSHFLDSKTMPCVAPPAWWSSAGPAIDSASVAQRFKLFHDRCIDAVKSAKRERAGHLAHLVVQYPSDDFDAVFTGKAYRVEAPVVGLVVSFTDHSKAVRDGKLDRTFAVLRVGPASFLSTVGLPAA